MVPSYMLKQVYVKGSLKNIEGGFEFALKNNIDSGTISGLGPLTVDGASFGPAVLTIKTNQNEMKGDQLSYRTPVYFNIGAQARIIVEGSSLAPGEHRLVLAVLTSEAGRLEIDVTDTL